MPLTRCAASPAPHSPRAACKPPIPRTQEVDPPGNAGRPAAGWLFGMLLGLAGLAQAQAPWRSPPQTLYPGLFQAVQESGIYTDSKVFADAIPDARPEEILDSYQRNPPRSRAGLQAFVQSHFLLPKDVPSPAAAAHVDLTTHIDQLWKVLTRRTPVAPPYSSLLPVPQPYVVPGGRFREMYYWDSYFTMLGLAPAHRQDLVQAMVADFAHLIDTYGHVPNGLRSYYLSRSQPPFFFEMVRLLSPEDPTQALARHLPQLKREYAYWMEGAPGLKAGQAHAHVVAMPDGSILNRYWDALEVPRDEAYAADIKLARDSHRPRQELFRELRAAAESGWDFSSRWFEDGHTRGSIVTTQIIPVDLNSLLFGLEKAIGAACERAADADCARDFTRRAGQRQAAIDRYLWDPAAGIYRDYRWKTGKAMPRVSAAMLYPLFEGAASPQQARAVAHGVSRELLETGGLRTTTLTTGEQWDAPNGWAPLQWIAISGLRRYGQSALAESLACRWMLTVRRLYGESGKLVEKYDVVTRRRGGGGEYPTQDGFGWTNGVMRALQVLYPQDARQTELAKCPAPRLASSP